MSDQQTQDLNTVIASAVQARIEAQVVEALSGTDVVQEMVSLAMLKEIEVDAPGDRYRRIRKTLLAHMIDQAILAATKTAIGRVVEQEAEAIEAAVAAELRRNVRGIAKTLAGQLQETARSAHGLSVELKYPGRY